MSFHWAGMSDDHRLREVRSMRQSMTVREIAAALRTSAGVISGFIYRRIQHPNTNPRSDRTIWTHEMDSRLRLEVSNGRSAREIAALVGARSERAVHARLKRIDLRMREVQRAIERAAKHPKPVGKPPGQWKEPAAFTATVTDPKRLLDRRMGFECAWIVGDPREPDPHCCGATTEFGQSWCLAHRAIVFGRPA